jgi:tRNA (adenine22-N1)-methyltransferase
MVRREAVAADIGTDHGLLICHLVASGIAPRGLACDINPLPLANARREIQRQGLENKIETIQTDGLDGLEGYGVDDFLLLGMGGDLLGEILLRHRWTRDLALRFILQPMTKAEHLRRVLYREGFALTEEKAVAAGRFVYTVMATAYTGERWEIDDFAAWTGRLAGQRDADSLTYLRRAAARARKKAAGLARSGKAPEEAAHYAALASQIEESYL